MNKLFEIESLDLFRNTSEEVLNDLHSSNSTMTLENNTITLAKEDLKQILSSNDFDMDKVRNDLQNRGWNTDRSDWFMSLLEEKSSELLYSTLLHHNSMFGEAVVDYDWRLKLVLGTSELKTLRYPLLQLVLMTNSANNPKKKMYEMNKDMLKRLIDVLEEIIH